MRRRTEIYARPATRFAASFIGTPPMNLFPLERRGAGMVLRGTAGPVLAPPLDDDGDRRHPAGDICGWRDTGIPAMVQHAEYLGADTVLACAAGEATSAGAAARPRRADARAAPVHLAIDEPLHLFDATTGQRMVPQRTQRKQEVVA